MIELENISAFYRSGEEEKKVLDSINLRIETGSCLVLCGKSGCGKTTVTRILNGLLPEFYEGKIEGKIWIDGRDVTDSSVVDRSKIIGSVFQNPKTQFFNLNTTAELAFGCENQGWKVDDIYRRMQKIVKELEIEDLINRNIFELSGGEKQRLACGSVLACRPKILILDEPSSNMDLHSIGKLRGILKKLKDAGVTMIVSEHRLHYLEGIVDKIAYMEKGRIHSEYTWSQLEELSVEERKEQGIRMLSFDELERRERENSGNPLALQFDDLTVKRGKKIITHMKELEIEQHQIVGIIGKNGAGKTTFLSTMLGFLRHQGSIKHQGVKKKRKELQEESFLVMQDVNRQLFANSVKEEVAVGVKEVDQGRLKEVLEEIGLEGTLACHPATLSGGQKQRLAVASAYFSGKQFLYFDEPTSGLDKCSMLSLVKIFREMKEKVACIFIVTHDPELIVLCADSILQLKEEQKFDYYKMDGAGFKKTVDYFKKSYETGCVEDEKEEIAEKLK